MQENSAVSGDPTQVDELSRLGLDPAQPFYDLNLAGAQGVPTPHMLARPNNPPELIVPDFGLPNSTIPPVQPHDLTGPGITYMPEFSADPALPGLDDYTHPYALDLAMQGMEEIDTADPMLASSIPTPTQIADSLYPGLGFSTLTVHFTVDDVDPLVPDLQFPDLIQQTHMPCDERPGDLDASALDVLHATPSYIQSTQSSHSDYPESWMDQQGMNSTRTRHLSLLNRGLDS